MKRGTTLKSANNGDGHRLLHSGSKHCRIWQLGERPAQILRFLLVFHCSDIKIQTKTTETPRQTFVLPNSTGVLLPAASGLPPPTSWSGSLTGVPPACWALLRGGCWSAAAPVMTCRMSPILIPPIPRRGGRKRLYFFI